MSLPDYDEAEREILDNYRIGSDIAHSLDEFGLAPEIQYGYDHSIQLRQPELNLDDDYITVITHDSRPQSIVGDASDGDYIWIITD